MSLPEKKEGAETWSVAAPDANHSDLAMPRLSVLQKNINAEAQTFLDLLADGQALTFQTFSDKKSTSDPFLTTILHGSLEEHLPRLIELNQRGAGIFVTVNQTDLKGRSTQNIIKVRAVFVDLDGAPLELVLNGPLMPHTIVQTSPKRYHAYWLVDDLPLKLFSTVQKALIRRFSADQSVHDLPRVMRLPGFYHNKESPFMVKVIESAATLPYKAAKLIEAFEIDSEDRKTNNLEKIANSISDPILNELYARGLVKRRLSNKHGAVDIFCPWVKEHTTGDQGTVYFEPNTNGYHGSGFKCQHNHCANRTIADLRGFLGLGHKDVRQWDEPTELKEDLLPVLPFSENMLPEALRPWIMDCSERMQVPSDYLATACIVSLGSLIGRKVGIHPKAYDDWLAIPNLWGAIVGRPSTMKSPAILEMMKPLEELANLAISTHKRLVGEFEYKKERQEALKKARKSKLEKAARNTDNLDEIFPISASSHEVLSAPPLKRYKTEDSTVEKIGEILLENPQGILIHRDELVGWLRGLEKYGHEGDRAFYLESWNGNGSYTVDRIGRGTLPIPALCLSIIGGIQPGPLRSYVYQSMTGGQGDDGLLQRFQLLVWPDAPKQWKLIDRKPNSEAKKKAYQIFNKLDAFEPFEPCSDSALKTRALRFSDDAQQEFDKWITKLEAKLRLGQLEPCLESHLAKYRSLMPCLALIFYLVEAVSNDIDVEAVDLPSILLAIAWCEYLETHAVRLYRSAETPFMESAKNLLEHIKKQDLPNGFSPRDVYHARHWSNLRNAEEVNGALKILEDFGWVQIEQIKTQGRPTQKIYIHPSLLKE